MTKNGFSQPVYALIHLNIHASMRQLNHSVVSFPSVEPFFVIACSIKRDFIDVQIPNVFPNYKAGLDVFL